jgi:DNA-binding SARP family transcriptional activator
MMGDTEMKKIEIELLGNCIIRCGAKSISDAPRKVWILLECLYLNRDRYVSMDEISSVLWGSKKMANPANSIKVLVFELRNRLDEFGQEYGKSMIQNINGAYRLSDEYEYESDADTFEQVAQKALGDFSVEEDRETLLDEAISLYKGNVILMDDECYWQRVIRSHYAELFERVVFQKMAILEEAGKEKEAKALCERAYITNPLSEPLRSRVEDLSAEI